MRFVLFWVAAAAVFVAGVASFGAAVDVSHHHPVNHLAEATLIGLGLVLIATAGVLVMEAGER